MKKQQIAAQKFQGTSKPETVSPNQEEIKQKHNLSCKSLAPKKKKANQKDGSELVCIMKRKREQVTWISFFKKECTHI